MKNAQRYVRRYLDFAGAPHAPEVKEMDYDVITEVWFDDQATLDATVAAVAAHRMSPEILPREERMFDRSSIRVVTVVECDSDFTSPGE
jgi:hypothetical protein